MVRRSRETPDAFGTSLLDLMTCSLGAVILVFLLRQAYQSGATSAAEERLAFQQEVLDLVQSQQAKAETRLKDAHERIRRAATGTLFGLPPLRGHVSVVIDRSGSMSGEKLECARGLVETLLRNCPGIRSVTIGTFAEQYRAIESNLVLGDAESASRQQSVAGLIAKTNGELDALGGGTNLIAAVRESVAGVRRHSREGGTVVLLSDGLHAMPGEVNLSIAEVVTRALPDVQPKDSPVVSVHCIGLFDAGDLRTADQLGRLLRAVSAKTDGVFLGFQAGGSQ